MPTAAPTLSPTASYSPKSIAISPGPQALATFDWRHPAPLTIAGWTLRSCNEQTPGACVDQARSPAGTITIDSVSLSTRPDLREIYRTKGLKAALRAAAGRYLDNERAAHARNCSPGYRFTPTATSSFTVRGTDVLSYGYVGRTQAGPADMAIRYAGIRDNRLTVIGANARDTGSCDPPSTHTFNPKVLTAFLPILDTTVRAVAFP